MPVSKKKENLVSVIMKRMKALNRKMNQSLS